MLIGALSYTPYTPYITCITYTPYTTYNTYTPIARITYTTYTTYITHITHITSMTYREMTYRWEGMRRLGQIIHTSLLYMRRFLRMCVVVNCFLHIRYT